MSLISPSSNPLKTVLTIVVGFAVLYVVTENKYLLITALSIGVLGLLSSFLARLIDQAWLLLAKGLGYIVPNILLSAVFFFVLFPIALLSRIVGKKDALQLKGKGNSTFVVNERKFEPSSFEHTF